MSKPKILLVEDERIVALDIRVRLQRLGYFVTGIVSTGEAAILAATEQQPDLALVDIRLKGPMDGIEVAERFRAELRVPVIYLTANTDPATVERAKQTEPFGYLVKPFDENELASTIEVALHNYRMETKLKESEAWLSAILRCIGDGVIATDRHLTVRFLNPIAEAVTGMHGHEALGKHLSQVFKVSDDGSGTVPEDPALQAVQQNAPISSRGAVHVARDGTRRILDLTSWPIRRVDGAVEGVVLALRDITEYRRASVALAEQAKELARSNLELERFAYVASHDLQEPLRMVSSYVQLLARRYQGRLDSNADEFIQFIVDGSKRMQKFIQDLLAYSRVSRQKKEVEMVDCEQILDQALQNLSAGITECGASITRDPLPRVPGDPTQLLQLFQNLLGNGIKFRGSDAPRIHVSAAEESGGWQFSVTDNGIGIDPSDQERIFMVFERGETPRDNPGTGIGLAICKKIVEGHHGKIWAESRPGEGSVFKFTLPAASSDSPASFGRNAEGDLQ